MALILGIDGDARSLERLRPRGHRLIVAATGTEGVRLARAKRPELVLLGAQLADGSGLDVCKVLKGEPATGRIPIVMIVERGDAIEEAVAKELGVLDYVVKPLSPAALLARLASMSLASEPRPAASSARFGSLTLGTCGRRVWVEGEPVELTPVELALLLVLTEGDERVCTRVELRARVWGEDGDDTTRVVDQYVKRLRKKLGVAGRYIETVHGVGYRFAKTRAGRAG